MTPIRISIKHIVLDAELFDTKTAQAVLAALPIETAPEKWGDEFYFEIPVQLPLDETATDTVKVGDIGYWPPGHAIAIFFGPTPISRGDDPIPASEVNIVGKVRGDATILKEAVGATTIKIERVI